MNRVVFGVVFFTILSKILGFAREIAVISVYGANELTDTYKLAMTLPILLVIVVSIAINTALIPVLTDAEKNKEKNLFFSKFLTLATVSIGIIMVLIIVFARPLSYVVSTQISDVVRGNVVNYMRLFTLLILFQVLSYAFVGYMQKDGRFYFAATMSIPLNIVMILGVTVFTEPSLFSLSIVTVLAYFTQLLWTSLPVFKGGYRFAIDFDAKDEHIKMFFVMIAPIILSLSAEQLNVLVDRHLASGLAAGSISLIDLSVRVKLIFYSLFVMSFLQVIYTKQTKIASESSVEDLIEYTRNTLSSILMIIIPITAGVMVLSYELIRVLYLRGQFTLEKASIAAILLILLSVGNISNTVKNMLSNMMFSLKKTKIPMRSTYLIVFTNIVLNLIVVRIFGIYGLVSATSVASIIGATYITLKLKNEFSKYKAKFFTPSFVKYIIASVLMSLVIFVVKEFLISTGDLLTLIISFFIGVIVYAITLYALKTKELYEATRMLMEYVSEKIG